MSYILDALKKSERQRPPGPVPDLFSVQGPLPPERSRLSGRALAVALVVGCAAVLAVWAWLGGGPPRDVATQAPVPPAEAVLPVDGGALPSQPPPVPAAAPVARDVEPEAAAPAGPAPARRAPRTASVPPGPQATASAPAPAPVPLPASAIAPPAGAPSAAPPLVPPAQPAVNAALPDAPRSPPSAVPPAPATVPGETPVPAPALPASTPSEPQPADSSPAVAPAPAMPVEAAALAPPDGRVVDLAALPDSVRNALPELDISGHVWSEEAGLRLLTVQDRIVREGEEAAPGVRIEQITQTGAILVFRGWRIRVADF